MVLTACLLLWPKGRAVYSFMGALCKMLLGGPYFVKLRLGDFKGKQHVFGNVEKNIDAFPLSVCAVGHYLPCTSSYARSMEVTERRLYR